MIMMTTMKNHLPPRSSRRMLQRAGSPCSTTSSTASTVVPEVDERDWEEVVEDSSPVLSVLGHSKNGKKLGRPFKHQQFDKSSTSKPSVKVIINRSGNSKKRSKSKPIPEFPKASSLTALQSPKTFSPRDRISKTANVIPMLTATKTDTPVQGKTKPLVPRMYFTTEEVNTKPIFRCSDSVSKSFRDRSTRKVLFGKEADDRKNYGCSIDSGFESVSCVSSHIPRKEDVGGTCTMKTSRSLNVISPDITSFPTRSVTKSNLPIGTVPQKEDVGGKCKMKKIRSLNVISPDITSFPTRSAAIHSVLPIGKCSISTPFDKLERRKDETEKKLVIRCSKPKSNLQEDSLLKNRIEQQIIGSTENLDVSNRCERSEVLDPRRLSSDTAQAVEKTAFVRFLPSVLSKLNHVTNKKKSKSYNDDKAFRGVVTDAATPRNEKGEPKKADGIARPSLIPGPNIISSPPLPSANLLCSLSVELPTSRVENWLEKVPECAVRPNLNNGGASSSALAAAETVLPRARSLVPVVKRLENVTESAKQYTSKINDRPRKRLPVPTVSVLDGKSIFMRDGKNIVVDADPKLRRDVLNCDPDVPWICSFCRLGPHVKVRVPYNGGWVCPYGMGDLFGPYFANLPSVYGKPSPKRETWMHGDCALWAGRLLLVRTCLKYLEETLMSADKEVCSNCGKNGATISCFHRQCNLVVHFPCAKSKEWKLDDSTFLAHCPKHR